MSEYYILRDKEAVPVKDTLEWATNFETGNRTVEKTEVGEILILTVFLGINHNFGKGVPLLFETMIFGGEHDQYQDRYSTWDEAVKGHNKAVELVKAAEIKNKRDVICSDSICDYCIHSPGCIKRTKYGRCCVDFKGRKLTSIL